MKSILIWLCFLHVLEGMTDCEITCMVLFATIGLTLLHHHSCQIKNINYDSFLFDGFVKEQFIQELEISQEWILGIVLKLIITFIVGLVLYMWWYWGLLVKLISWKTEPCERQWCNNLNVLRYAYDVDNKKRVQSEIFNCNLILITISRAVFLDLSNDTLPHPFTYICSAASGILYFPVLLLCPNLQNNCKFFLWVLRFLGVVCPTSFGHILSWKLQNRCLYNMVSGIYIESCVSCNELNWIEFCMNTI